VVIICVPSSFDTAVDNIIYYALRFRKRRRVLGSREINFEIVVWVLGYNIDVKVRFVRDFENIQRRHHCYSYSFLHALLVHMASDSMNMGEAQKFDSS
jgi:hypothetical protein